MMTMFYRSEYMALKLFKDQNLANPIVHQGKVMIIQKEGEVSNYSESGNWSVEKSRKRRA